MRLLFLHAKNKDYCSSLRVKRDMFLCGEGKKRSDKPLLVVWHGGGLVESVAGESTSDKGFFRSVIAWLVSWGKGNSGGGESPS